MLHGHGDDIPQELEANFSSNVWHGAKNFWLQEHLNNQFLVVGRYPEVFPQNLIHQIAQFHSLQPQNILVTNGATEAIYLIAQAFQGSHTAIMYPTFAEYADACSMYHHSINFVPENDFLTLTLPEKGVMFLCNPNNPTGKAYSSFQVKEMLDKNPQLLFVIDESYANFTLTPVTANGLIKAHSNLIIIKSLTKSYAIPGLRLGYILSNNALIEKITRFKIPWTVNALAIEAGNYIFSNIDDYQIPINRWLSETAWLMNEISGITGFSCVPTDTTYFLCTTENGNASELKEYLLNEHAILIRDASNFKGLTPQYFRICTQAHTDNLKLIDALKQWSLQF